MTPRLLALAALLAGCGGGPEGTWLFALDRDAGTGCSEDYTGQLQYEVQVFVDDEAATAWVAGRGSVLTGSWTKDGVSLGEAEGQTAASTVTVAAEFDGPDLVGTWDEIAPTCTQRMPLTAWRLSDDPVAP